jgi:hypothetical protein
MFQETGSIIAGFLLVLLSIIWYQNYGIWLSLSSFIVSVTLIQVWATGSETKSAEKQKFGNFKDTQAFVRPAYFFY